MKTEPTPSTPVPSSPHASASATTARASSSEDDDEKLETVRRAAPDASQSGRRRGGEEDAEDEYHKEVMAQRAAESARDELERKLKISEKLSEQNDEILLLKDELSSINTKLTLLEVSDPSNASIADLEKRAEELTREIKVSLSGLYDLSHSIEGVPVSKLLNEWLNYMLEADKAKARINQFELKMQGIELKYDKFAPLGSQLSKLDRKVDVAEREYLEILHGLNQAKIKEQSVAMKANLTVVDETSLPLPARAA